MYSIEGEVGIEVDFRVEGPELRVEKVVAVAAQIEIWC